MTEICTDCDGKGWDVYNADETGWGELQRCDTCEQFETDEDAVAAALEAGRIRQGVMELS